MVLKFAFLIVLLGRICELTVGQESDYCYADDANPFRYFSSKTAYDVVRAAKMRILDSECKPKHVWALIRHGTRFSTSEGDWDDEKLTKIRNEIIANVDGNEKRGKLCKKDIENLKTWTYKGADDDMMARLTTQGKKDLASLAARLKTNLDSLLNVNANTKDNFLFLTSSKSRCKSSSIAFTNEMFGTSFENLEGNNIRINDTLLRIFDGVKKTETPEKAKFIESSHMKQLIADVSERLGFEQPLSYEAVSQLYTCCAYENAWEPFSKPPFCAAFTRDQLQVFEYLHDLSAYYKRGYGNSDNAKYACVVVRDLETTLSEAVQQNSPSKKGTFYFSHSETIVPVLTKLGLYKDDEPLRSDNFERLKDTRRWRTSIFDPFAANLIVVLYECSQNHKVMFYNNENVINFPECDETGVCKLSVIQKKLKNQLSEKACTIGLSSDDSEDAGDDEDQTDPLKPEDDKKTTPSPTRPLHENSSACGLAFYSNYEYLIALTFLCYIKSLLR